MHDSQIFNQKWPCLNYHSLFKKKCAGFILESKLFSHRILEIPTLYFSYTAETILSRPCAVSVMKVNSFVDSRHFPYIYVTFRVRSAFIQIHHFRTSVNCRKMPKVCRMSLRLEYLDIYAYTTVFYPIFLK